MADLTFENALKAMRAANDRGDADAARRMAQLAKQLQGQQPAEGDVPANSFIGQVNAGIADTVGGLVDLVNPFDKPHALNPFPEGTGSAATGLRNVMQAGNAAVATDDPKTLTESLGRGTGEAVAAFAPAVQLFQRLRGAGGIVGQIADDAYLALTTAKPGTLASTAGIATEMSAGAISQAAQDALERAGYGELAQNIGAILAPLSAPAAVQGVKAVGRMTDAATEVLPGAKMVKDAGRDLVRALVPMTNIGAREVARSRLFDIMGGEERAMQEGAKISIQDELGRTAAEQIGDPNLLGLQDAVKAESPVIREALDAGRDVTTQTITSKVRELGGDIDAARTVFQDQIDTIISETRASARQLGQDAGQEGTASVQMVNRLKTALDDAVTEERALWEAIPKDANVTTTSTSSKIRELIEATPRAQQKDIPKAARDFLEQGLDRDSVAEMHGLYSELRRIARSAMSGNDQNRNLARVSNDIADAILEDLGTGNPDDLVGRLITDARSFSRALHEKFDQGAVGRILSRTIDGDERVAPETALRKTVGLQGEAGGRSVEDITGASPAAGQDVETFLKSQFAENVLDASDNFTGAKARTWMRNNAEALSRFPELRTQMLKAVDDQDAMEVLAKRYQAGTETRAAYGEVEPVVVFNKGQPKDAIKAILGAPNPVKAAKSVATAARKDPSGEALAGVKGAFTDYLTDDIMSLPSMMSDPQIAGSMARVFDAGEMLAMKQYSKAVERLQTPSRNVGEVINSPTSKIVDAVIRVAAVKGTAGLRIGGGPGASLQIAQMTSGRTKEFLRNMTNAGARDLLLDASKNTPEGRELMRTLLTDLRSGEMSQKAISKLAPYLTGGAAALTE